jgi:uncharacterized damage-inducible protein DinB
MLWKNLAGIDGDEDNPADLQRIIRTASGADIPRNWIIRHLLEHEIHHRGELSLLLEILGRTGLDL